MTLVLSAIAQLKNIHLTKVSFLRQKNVPQMA